MADEPKTIDSIARTPYKQGFHQDVCCPQRETRSVIMKDELRQLLIDRCKELRKKSEFSPDNYDPFGDQEVVKELMRIGNISDEELK